MYAVILKPTNSVIFMGDRPEAGELWEVQEGVDFDLPLNYDVWQEGTEAPDQVLCISTIDPKHYRLFKYARHRPKRFRSDREGLWWDLFEVELATVSENPTTRGRVGGDLRRSDRGDRPSTPRDPRGALSCGAVIVFDSGPLNLACIKPGDLGRDALTSWRIQADLNGAILVIPEIADYEVRRELIRKNAQGSLSRLDELCRQYRYLPITTEVMRKAAEFWAGVRVQGQSTADDKALDGDAILAAQAFGFVGHGDQLTVATENHRHLSRFGLNALSWQAISP